MPRTKGSRGGAILQPSLAMARTYIAVLLSALLVASDAIFVGRVYRPVVVTPFGAAAMRASILVLL